MAPDVHHEIVEYLFDQATNMGLDKLCFVAFSLTPPRFPCSSISSPLKSQDQDQNKYIRAMLEAVQARRRMPWGALPVTGEGPSRAPPADRAGKGSAALVATVSAATHIMPVGADRWDVPSL